MCTCASTTRTLIQISNSQAGSPVLFGRRRVRLSSSSPHQTKRGAERRMAPKLPRPLARDTARPLAIGDAAPSGAPHAASFLNSPGPLFRARTGGTHHPGASAPFVRSLVQPDYRQTLVVGPGGCPGSPGRPGANRTARAPHQPEGVTPPTTRRFGLISAHLPVCSATDRRRRRPSASRVS